MSPRIPLRMPPQAPLWTGPLRLLIVAGLALSIAACSTSPRTSRPSVTAEPRDGAAEGAFFKDDGPGERSLEELDRIPEPVPRLEGLLARANRPYQVEGQLYIPMRALEPYRAEGMASWYGRRYHGRPTASGEVYDMYALSAAHPVLPLPSYARVTHLASGRAIVVRINDRGPFIGGREIDLSYAAAHRLGMRTAGSARVRVDLLLPGRDF